MQVHSIGRVDRLPLAEQVTTVASTNVTGTFRAFLPHVPVIQPGNHDLGSQ